MPTYVGARLSVRRAVLKAPTRLFTFLLIAKNVVSSCCEILHVQFVRMWIHCPKIQTDGDEFGVIWPRASSLIKHSEAVTSVGSYWRAEGTMVKWGNRGMCTSLVFPDIMDIEEKHHVIFLLGQEKSIWSTLGQLFISMGIILLRITTAFLKIIFLAILKHTHTDTQTYWERRENKFIKVKFFPSLFNQSHIPGYDKSIHLPVTFSSE